MTAVVVGPTVLCDDELAALAHSRQGMWSRPLATVDLSSPRELTAAVARGYRSLLIRGLLTEASEAGAGLLLPLSLVGTRPGIMGTWVTEDLGQAQGAERYELFVNEAGTFVAVTTRPGGVHSFVEVDGRDGLAFFADLARTHQVGAEPDGAEPDGAEPDGAEPDGAEPDGAGPDGAGPDGAEPDGGEAFCVLVRGPDQQLAGGFVIRPAEVTRLLRGASGELRADGVVQIAPTLAAWRAEIGTLLNDLPGPRSRCADLASS